MKTSKQSIITVVFFPKEYWKHWGIVCHNSSLSGQYIKGESLISMVVNQDKKILDTVEMDTPNR